MASGILAESAIVAGLPEGAREKNLDADLLSPRSLFDRALGRRVIIQRTDRATGRVREVQGTIRSSKDGGMVLATAEGVEAIQCAGLPEKIVYDAVPPGLSAKPTLSIAVDKPSVVAVRDIAITTTCPHHLVPAIGRATVAFKATNKVIGLGTVAALVDAHARRLALQENIGEAVVEDLASALAPEWVACRLVLAHGCMIARGERAHGSTVETIAGRGNYDVSLLR